MATAAAALCRSKHRFGGLRRTRFRGPPDDRYRLAGSIIGRSYRSLGVACRSWAATQQSRYRGMGGRTRRPARPPVSPDHPPAPPDRLPCGLEAWARSRRYEALSNMARAAGMAVVATAHTRDDLEETLWLKLWRGCAPAGFRPPRRCRRLTVPVSGGGPLALRQTGVWRRHPWRQRGTSDLLSVGPLAMCQTAVWHRHPWRQGGTSDILSVGRERRRCGFRGPGSKKDSSCAVRRPAIASAQEAVLEASLSHAGLSMPRCRVGSVVGWFASLREPKSAGFPHSKPPGPVLCKNQPRMRY
jgi:hypothetical protein